MTRIPEPNQGAPVLEGETNFFTVRWFRFMSLTFDALGGKSGIPPIYGEGDPNGVFIGSPGQHFHRTDGGAGTSFYVKESGIDTDTGWAAK